MKRVIEFFRWLIKILTFSGDGNKSVAITNEKLECKIEFVEDLPLNMRPETYYILQDGLEPELLGFKCPCGCGSDILLNLLRDASPSWSHSINENQQIEVYPSVWRKNGCRSHFFVTNGEIKWV